MVASVSSLVALGIEYYVLTIAYPAFGMVAPREFAAIHALHTERITYAIGPALLAAFATNAVLIGIRPLPIPLWLPAIATLAGAVILGYTAFVAVPLHAKLAEGADPRAIASLNASEWVRGLATLAQALADVVMLGIALRS